MTTLQEALDIADILAGALQVSRGTAYDMMRAALAQQDESAQVRYLKSELAHALAQQGERKNCPQPEICGSKECEFCRDTAAPAPQAQERSTCNHCDGTGWAVRDPDIGTDQECFVCDGSGYVKEEPAPQAQPTSGDYALGYAEGFNDACKPAPQPAQLEKRRLPPREDSTYFRALGWNEAIDAMQSAQPVAQYDKTEMNAFVQDLYDKKMQEGKHGFYETLFHVVHKAIARVGIREVK